MADLKESTSIMNSQENDREDAKRIRKLIDKNWCSDISAVAIATRSQMRYNKDNNLPNPEELHICFCFDYNNDSLHPIGYHFLLAIRCLSHSLLSHWQLLTCSHA